MPRTQKRRGLLEFVGAGDTRHLGQSRHVVRRVKERIASRQYTPTVENTISTRQQVRRQ
jgi:hypothetical protein